MWGEIAGIASGILGGLGGGEGESSKPTSGFETLPKEIKDYLLKDLFPQMKSYQSSPYEGIPLRRLNASDLDPVFGSKARQDLQAYRDYQMANKPQETTPTEDPKAMADMEARLIARQMLGQAQPGMKVSNVGGVQITGRQASDFAAGLMDDETLAALGKHFGGVQAGKIHQSNNPEDPETINYLMGIPQQLEAMRRKGLVQ